MKSKVNWKDKSAIEDAVNRGTGYASTLENLGLQPVSANVNTLKKYITFHEIDTSHFDSNINDIVAQKTVTGKVMPAGVPHVEIVGEVVDPKHGVKLELDWNPEFIEYLKQGGITGANEEQIVGKWLSMLYKNTADQLNITRMTE